MLAVFQLLAVAQQTLSDGTTMRVTVGIVSLVAVTAVAMNIRRRSQVESVADGSKPVYAYRGGPNPDLPEDPWAHLSLAKIDRVLYWFSCEEGVKGQDEAIEVLRDELYMARARLSGAASGISTKPKIVLFFAGPTGVGKTITAQKLAKFLFGTENRFLRLDMTEFKEEHTFHKLVGAPPSYVGYNQGGLLTNAVRATPHLVVLVDEVEKAHPKVLDLFLQILDHGHLTDGRGQTVSFSETAIIFTSNLGTRTEDGRGKDVGERARLEQVMRIKDPDLRKTGIREHFVRAVERFFTHEISRPELLNRIGDNIIPFNFVDNAEIQKEVVRSILMRLKEHVEQEYSKAGQSIEFSDKIPSFIVDKESEAINEFGARRITHAIRQEVLRPLAPALLRAEQAGRGHRLFSVVVSMDGMRLEVEETER
ncbi:MAG TPA: AAA family ATPase [Planctomycetota bacterium]|nr:AAA family ATPase [Planctomycetota bacterium]